MIAIIAVLAAIVLVNVSQFRSKARDARRKADIEQIQKAIMMYYADNGAFPTQCHWSTWACWSNFIPSQYISRVPVDPLNIDLGNCQSVQNCYAYRYCNLGNKFVVIANLENPPSQSMGNNPDCSHGGPNWYWVSN